MIIGAFGLLLVLAGGAVCYLAMALVLAPGVSLVLAVIGSSACASGWILLLGAEILFRMKQNAKAVNDKLDGIRRSIEAATAAPADPPMAVRRDPPPLR